MTLFVLVMLPVVVSLGQWQLQRAELKRGYEAAYFDRMALPVVSMPQDPTSADFLRVRLLGAYDREQYFLVDNQVHEGRPGYWIVAVFHGEDGRRWLVNRGWIAAPSRREELPVVDVPPGRVAVSGVVWPQMGLVPLLAEDRWESGWPKRVQRLDVANMAAAAGGLAPIEIRLEAGEPGVAYAASLGHDFKARTHEGYAVQWFGLGGVLILGYIAFGFRRHD